MKLVNGWSQEEIQLLCERTDCSTELVIEFCKAVDKQLYKMLPTEAKRATLHFHLRKTTEEDTYSDNTKLL